VRLARWEAIFAISAIGLALTSASWTENDAWPVYRLLVSRLRVDLQPHDIACVSNVAW